MNMCRMIVVATFVSSLSILSGCTHLPSSDTRPYGSAKQPGSLSEPLPAVSLEEGDLLLKVTKDGVIVPLTREGKPYTRCDSGPDAKNRCRIFKGDITVTDLDSFSVTRLSYTGSGMCELVSFYNPVMRQVISFYNPNDPDCAQHHQK